MSEPFSLNVLTQSYEFNEMAEYLFSIRWEEKKERFSVVSLINHSNQPTAMTELEQLQQKIEQFTLSKHGDVEIKIRCHKLKSLNKEVQGVVNKVKRDRASGGCVGFNERRGDLKTFFYDKARHVRNKMESAIRDAVFSFEDSTPYLDAKEIEKELNFMVSTLESTANKFLEENVNDMPDKLNVKFNIGSSLCREFVYRQIHENIEGELWEAINNNKYESVRDSVPDSCKMADKIIIELLEELAKKSKFWEEYTMSLSKFRRKNNKSDDEIDVLISLEVVYEDLLNKINFLLDAYFSAGNKKIVFQWASEDERNSLFSWNRVRGEDDSTVMYYVMTPAIVDDGNKIPCQGVGWRVRGSRLMPYRA